MRYVWILSTILIIFATCSVAKAQRFQVPQDYSFDTKDGYHKYDDDIIRCVNWLEKTPVKENNDKIKKAGNFLAEWLTGCPYLHFSQNIKIEAAFANSPELRIYYMGGWARYALQNPGKINKLQCCIEGIRCVVKVYRENQSLPRDTNINEMADLDQQGKLKEWVEDRI